MAGQNYEIEFGGQMIKVPAWASQESIDSLESLSKDNISKLKKLVDIETGTLRAVSEMLKAQERLRSQTTKDNEKLIKELLASQKAIEDAVDENTKETKKSKDDEDRKSKKLREEREQAEKDLINSMKRGLDGIRKSAKDAVGAISKGDFEGLATAIGGVVGLGAAAGFAAGAMMNFAKALSELSNVGAGFGMSLQEIRQLAASAGTGLDGLAKIAQNNGIAFRALGGSANEGIREFARMSREARGLAFSDDEVQERARDMGIIVSSSLSSMEKTSDEYKSAMEQLREQTFQLTGDIRDAGRSLTQFGLSNEEANNLLAEEIELRKLNGQSEAQIRNEAAGSMRSLVSETTKLANLTGINRRDAMRAGLDAATNDPRLREFRSNFETEYTALMGTLANTTEGVDISKALTTAIANPNMDFATVLGTQNPELLDTLNRIPGAMNKLAEMERFAEQNVGTMDPARFRAEVISRFAQLGDNMSSSQREGLMTLSDAGDQQARSALNLIDSLNGLERSVERTMEEDAKLTAANENAEAAAIDTQARLESLTNQIKASMTTDLLEGLNIDMEGSGEDLVQALSGMENQFLELGFLGAIKEGISDANWYLKGILAALAVGALAGPIGGLIRGVGAFTRVGGSFLRTAGSALRSAPGAVVSGVRTTARVGTSAAIAARNAPGAIASAVKNAPGAVVAGADAAATALKNAPGAITDAVKAGINDATTTAARTAGNVVTETAEAGAKAVASAADDVAEAGAKVAAGAVDDVAGAAARTVGTTVAEQVAETTAKSLGKGLVKKIPLIGAVAGLGLGAWRAMSGDFVGAGMEVASGAAGIVPGVGTAASIAIDAALLARDIAQIYTDNGMSEEDAARAGAVDASEAMIADMTDRITRAEGGENVYWGSDAEGIAEDRSDMQDLLLSEIVRLTDVMETTGQLSEKEAAALENYNRMLNQMDMPSGDAILSDVMDDIADSDRTGALLMAENIDRLKEKLNMTPEGDADRATVMKEYADAVIALKQIEESGVSDEAKRQLAIADVKGIDVESLILDKAAIELKRAMAEHSGVALDEQDEIQLAAINEQLESLKELKPSDISTPSDTFLKMYNSTLAKYEKDSAEKAAMEQEEAPKAIGFDEERYKNLKKHMSFEYSDAEMRQKATIMGYEDDEKNKKYQKLKDDVFDGDSKLSRMEADDRYMAARSTELARQMGNERGQVSISEDGSEISVKRQNSMSRSGRNITVNGQVVPQDLLNSRERDRFEAAARMQDQMNNRPVSSPVVKANENTDTTENKNNNNINRQTEPEKTRDLLEENNRLLRKTIETIEQGQ